MAARAAHTDGSIGPIRLTPLICGLLALTTVLLVATAPAGAATKRTVLSEVARRADSEAITRADADRYRSTYRRALSSRARLEGTRRRQLSAVIANVDAVARAGRLYSGRMPLAFLTLRRNREWWTTKALLAYGQRVAFPGSSLVWQYYPGQGIQVQWLATFGKANGFMTGGRRTYDDNLRRLLAQATALAAPRAGGIAWESWFRFDGGRPPWVSALSQGTALQAYSRASQHLYRPSLLGVAQHALGIFRKAPPTGVRVKTDAGARLLIYSFRPKLRVLNAFAQAVNGLRDYAALSRNAEAQQLYREAEAQLRVSVPQFDTGAWSLYALGGRESGLGYHKLVRDFLRGTCKRTQADRARAGDGVDVNTLPDPAVYCDTAARFTKDLTAPPVLDLSSKTSPRSPQRKHRISLPYTLSKVSTVTTRVTRKGKPIAVRVARLGHGRHSLRFTAKLSGRYDVSIRAVDPAGNASSATTRITVRR